MTSTTKQMWPNGNGGIIIGIDTYTV